jgi:DNA polymerase-3 subunit gamma/tau
VPVDEMISLLKQIAKHEKIKVDEDALIVIARQATGSVRDAISLLDQLSSTGDKIDLTLTQTVLGTAASKTVLDLVASIEDQEPAHAMDSIHRALDSGVDPRSLARQIVDYLRGLLLIQLGNDDQVEVTKEVKTTMSKHARAFSTRDVLRMMNAFNAAAVDTRGGWQPSLSLELAVAEVLEKPADSPANKPKEKPVTAKAEQRSKKVSTPEKKPAKTGKPKTMAKAPVKAAKKDAQEKGKTKKTETSATGLAEVVKVWRDIRSIIKPNHPGIEALLNSCKPLEVRRNELILGFQSETVRALMDMEEKIEIAQTAIKDVLGVDMSIKCVVANAKGQLPPDVNPDGMVAAAIQNGGEIVDVQD